MAFMPGRRGHAAAEDTISDTSSTKNGMSTKPAVAERIIQFRITPFNCQNCVDVCRSALLGVPGVQRVETIADGVATISLLGDTAEANVVLDVVRAIEATGKTATPVNLPTELSADKV